MKHYILLCLSIYFSNPILLIGQNNADSIIDQLITLQQDRDQYSYDSLSVLLDEIKVSIQKNSSDVVQAHYYITRGRCLQLKPDWSRSANHFIDALNLNEQLPDTLINQVELYLAVSLLGSARQDTAKIIFEQLLNKKDISRIIQLESHTYLGAIHNDKFNFDSSRYHFTAFYNLFDSYDSKNDSLLYAYAKFREGHSLIRQEDIDGAIRVLDESIRTYKINCGDKCKKLTFPLGEMAKVHMRLRDYHQAIQWFNKSIDNIIFNYGKSSKSLWSVYNNIGSCYGEIGQPEKSIQFKTKSINLAIAFLGPDYPELAPVYQSISVAYSYIQDYEKALESVKEAERLYALKNKNNPRLFFAYDNYSVIYKELGEYNLAIEYCNKNYKIVIENLGPNHSFVSHVYRSLADIYRDMAKFDLAIYNYRKAINHGINNFGKKHPDVIRNTTHLAMAYVQSGQYENAINALKESLAIHSVEDPSQYVLLLDPIRIRDVVVIIGETYYKWYEAVGEEAYLDSSIAYFEKSFHLTDFVRKSRDGSLVSFLLTERNHERMSIYALACNRFDKKYDSQTLSKAYEKLEKYRVMEFRANYLNPETVIDSSLFPKEIVSTIDSIQKVMSGLKSNIKKAELAESTTLINIEDSLFSTFLDLENFLATVKKDHPQYFDWRYEENVVNVETIQQSLLEENEAMIQFQYHGALLISFIITNESINIISDTIDIELEDVYKDYLDKISFSNPDQLRQLEMSLGNQLLEKSIAELPSRIEKIIIVPDGLLHFIPLETLRPDVLEGRSVFEQYIIRYASSASILKGQESSHVGNSGLLAVTPSKIDVMETNEISQEYAMLVRAGNMSLPGAREECDIISTLTQGDVFDSQKHDKASFFNKQSNYNVLHMSMHAFLDDQHPLDSYMLLRSSDATQEDRLYGHEICAQSFDQEMVVLSACNTSLGSTINGNGILSLSQAFFQAGVSSTVTSLWKVPDHSTRIIMQAFYNHLTQGVSKSESLHKAKKDYLDQTINPKERSPYYWAGFILTGSDASMSFTSSFPSSLLVISILLFTAIVIGFFIKSKRTSDLNNKT